MDYGDLGSMSVLCSDVQISMLHAMLRAGTGLGFETNLDHIRIVEK